MLWPVALVAAGLIGVAYGGTLSTLWRMWSHNANYSHGFLILPVSIFLIWRERGLLAALPTRSSWAGLSLVATAMVLQLAGVRGDVSMFQAYSFIVLLAGLIWTWWGRPVLRKLAFPLLFLIFMAPTFPVLINLVSFRLKTVAAVESVRLAQAFGVAVTRQGMDLYFPTGMMTIEGACSGLNSLIALLALGSLFAYFSSAALWRRWLLFLFAVPVALGANIVRITSLCVYAALSTTERATGLFHDIGGFVLFGVALLCLAALKRLLRC
jgi:exosortase